jgi:hypothetical protein
MVNLISKRADDAKKARQKAVVNDTVVKKIKNHGDNDSDDDVDQLLEKVPMADKVKAFALPKIFQAKPKEPDDLTLMPKADLDLLTELKFKKRDKKKLWTAWNQMIGASTTSSKMTYEDFLFYFALNNETWVKRTFNVSQNLRPRYIKKKHVNVAT